MVHGTFTLWVNLPSVGGEGVQVNGGNKYFF